MVRWIIIGFMIIAAILGGYLWLNQSEPRPIPPAGWQTIQQDTLIVSLPPEYIVLNPKLASANLDFTKTYSGTYENLAKIATDAVKVDFLAVNPENGDTIAIMNKVYKNNYASVFKQVSDIADLMLNIRKHNQQSTDLYKTSDLYTKYHKNLMFWIISEDLQYNHSKNIFELIGQNIVLEDD